MTEPPRTGEMWCVKVGRHLRAVEIVDVDARRGWLVGEVPWVPGCRRWWIRKQSRFLRLATA